MMKHRFSDDALWMCVVFDSNFSAVVILLRVPLRPGGTLQMH